MRKYLLSFIVLFLISFYIPQGIQAQAVTKEEPKNVISVTGTASENFAPDTAIIILSVETNAPGANESAIKNSKNSETVVNKLKTILNSGSGDTIKTTSYNLHPTYEYTNNKRIFTGYQVNNQITVTTKQIKNVGNIIDTAISNGANQVQSVNFIIADDKENFDKVLIKAAKQAEKEAQTVAQALGVKIIGVKQASVSLGNEPVYYARNVFMSAAAPNAASPTTPIEAGNVKIQGNVNVDFLIENKSGAF